jgi:hypothetical protein
LPIPSRQAVKELSETLYKKNALTNIGLVHERYRRRVCSAFFRMRLHALAAHPRAPIARAPTPMPPLLGSPSPPQISSVPVSVPVSLPVPVPVPAVVAAPLAVPLPLPVTRPSSGPPSPAARENGASEAKAKGSTTSGVIGVGVPGGPLSGSGSGSGSNGVVSAAEGPGGASHSPGRLLRGGGQGQGVGKGASAAGEGDGEGPPGQGQGQGQLGWVKRLATKIPPLWERFDRSLEELRAEVLGLLTDVETGVRDRQARVAALRTVVVA